MTQKVKKKTGPTGTQKRGDLIVAEASLKRILTELQIRRGQSPCLASEVLIPIQNTDSSSTKPRGRKVIIRPLSGLCVCTEEKEKSAVPTRVSLPFKVLPGSDGCFQNWLDALRPKFEMCPEHRKKGSLPSYLPFAVTYRWRSTKRGNLGGS